jgi:hypothetical protein
MIEQSATDPIPTKPLRGLSDIRRFFYRNETPIYFLSATNFNLLGAGEWTRSKPTEGMLEAARIETRAPSPRIRYPECNFRYIVGSGKETVGKVGI